MCDIIRKINDFGLCTNKENITHVHVSYNKFIHRVIAFDKNSTTYTDKDEQCVLYQYGKKYILTMIIININTTPTFGIVHKRE